MLAQYKTRTNVFILLGLILQLVGRCFGEIGVLICLAGAVCFIVGCCSYAKGKGHSAAWGLLGLLSIIGLIILVCFSDRHK